MSKYDYFIQSTQSENYTCALYRVKPNTPYEYEDIPTYFNCRPANQKDKKEYRITKGVLGNNTSVYLFATNLPEDVSPGDRVLFLGTIMNVESVGFFFDDSGIVDASIMSAEYIEARSPKGITLK